jgi:hypothetical protein
VLGKELNLLNFTLAFLKKRHLKDSAICCPKDIPHFKSQTGRYLLIIVEKTKHLRFVATVHQQTVETN